MSDSTPSPAPAPAAPAPGKGIHPLVWVGIGCGGLMVLLLGGCLVLGLAAKATVEKVAEDEDFRNKLIGTATNSEVATDEETGEMVFTSKETGESVAFGVGKAGDGEGGQITIRNPETGEEVKFGGSKTVPEGFPKAVPIYKGAGVEGSSQMTTPKGGAYTVALSSNDDVDTVAAFYSKALKKAGYEAVTEIATGKGKHLAFKHKDRKDAMVNVTVAPAKEGGTQIALHVIEPKE